MAQLTISEIINAVEAGSTVELQFADREAALAFRNNVLSRAYKQRAQMRDVLADAEFESISAIVNPREDSFLLSFTLAPPKEPKKYSCTIINASNSEASNG